MNWVKKTSISVREGGNEINLMIEKILYLAHQTIHFGSIL